MKLLISPQAAEDIETVARWWAANRPAAPELFDAEVLRALELISTSPRAGAALRASQPPDVRRVALPKTRYLLYYRVLDAQGEVRVLRLWHMSRGKAPRL